MDQYADHKRFDGREQVVDKVTASTSANARCYKTNE
jgi:hypothetical protein